MPTKRPNPAVAASERRARASEDMASLASGAVKDKQHGQATANATGALARKRRAAADKIKQTKPNLIAYGE